MNFYSEVIEMTFEQLLYFVKAFQTNSISTAADFLHVSRQVLSRSISNLEHELNIELFHRSSLGITPTHAGQEFYISASKILSEHAYIVRKLNSFNVNNNHTELSIMLPESMIDTIGNAFAKELAEAFPDTSFDIIALPEKRSNRFYIQSDIAFISVEYLYTHKEKAKDKWSIEYLLESPLYVWLANEHPLLQTQDNLSFENLKNYPFCIYKHSFSGSAFFNIFLNADAKIANTEYRLQNLICDSNYFTIDCKINNSFLYEHILKNNACVLKKTTERLHNYIIYRNDIKYSQIDFIKNYLKNTLQNDSTESSLC